ncbi:hypothetical protein ACFFX0_22215 [Citricoccus parietis]|uniref:Uncharacterized protein n=1 Tax=Citricoccus parietis TaxID=592307 RepID=A0ABV5G5P0_9MICC
MRAGWSREGSVSTWEREVPSGMVPSSRFVPGDPTGSASTSYSSPVSPRCAGSTAPGPVTGGCPS